VPDKEVSGVRADALLKERKITEKERRSAYILLADLSLLAADCDWDTARTLLQDPLEAIGALPYEPGAQNGVKRCSRCRQFKDVEEFARNTRSPDKRAAMCNQCKNRERRS
jgi:hypothetical protein